MSQIFPPSANSLARATILGILVLVLLIIAAAYLYVRSSWWNNTDVFVEQPVQFSHDHHVAGLGIDCRYCHATVENSSFADIPPTHTCMSCHSQVWADAPILEPVRESYETGMPIEWNRVHDVGDFVYFDHSIHVQNGIGCSTCHGPVDRMPLMYKAEPMTMEWCLDCHQAPERYIRPREEVFNMEWQPPPDQLARGRALIEAYGIGVERLTDCYVCHR